MTNPPKKAPRKRVRKDNPEHQTTSREVKPIERTNDTPIVVEEPVPDKYMKQEKVGTPKLGRSPNYVTSVGLGNLEVITADGTTDV